MGLVHPHLPPGAGTPAGLILAIEAFRYQPFKPMLLYRPDDVFHPSFDRLHITQGFLQLRDDLLFEYGLSFIERLVEQALSCEHQEIKYEINQRSVRGLVILEQIEGRSSLIVERRHLPINERFIRQTAESL